MTFANQLTLIRLVAIVPVMAALYIQFPGNRGDSYRLSGRHPGTP
jgi:hypothetical protein